MDKTKANTKKAKVPKVKLKEFLLVDKCTGCEERKYVRLRLVSSAAKCLTLSPHTEDRPHISRGTSESWGRCGTFEPYEIYELKKRRV